jgi:MFS family permease
MAESKWLNIYSLALLTLGYIIGELAHFLIATTSPEVAKDIQYGDLGCLGETEFNCGDIEVEDTCTGNCTWDYTGTGLDYQVLAGPAFIVTFTFSALIMGFLADNFSRPLILSVAISVFSVCCILMGFSQSYWQLVVLRMGIALGEGACRPASGSLIAEFFGPENRAKANGVFSWGVYYGYGLAFIFGIYITQADILGYGWRSSYVIAGAPGLVIAALLLFIKDPRYKQKNEDSNEDSPAVEKPKFVLKDYLLSIKKGFWQPAMICLLASAAVRHTAGYSWANNNFNYFNEYHKGKEIGYWFMICSIVGGGCGVLAGGIFSDILVKRMGIRSRLWLLGGFHLLATPFAALTLHLSPPYAFATLMGYYFFAETWFAILFTVILEIVPDNVRSITVSTFLFIMNNLGGNIPILIQPVAEAIGLKPALYMFWPGLVGLSGIMFALSSFTLPSAENEKT